MTEPRIRPATAADLPAIVAMLADDPLGAERETPGDPAPYRAAFRELDADPHQHLVVAERDRTVVGTLQLTVVPGLSHTAMSRGQVEAVRIHRDERGTGLGTVLLEWAIAESKRQGCGLVQLTTDMTREAAHRFYERLGFVKTHYGLKLTV